jgi:glycosyltransferase involved in cell wall biosynthesis
VSKNYWILTTEFPPVSGGGIGTYCHINAIVLQKGGFDVTVFVSDNSVKKTVIDRDAQGGFRIVRFSPYLSDTFAYLGYETMQSMSFACIVEHFFRKEGMPFCLEAQEYNGIAYFILQKKLMAFDAFKDLFVVITCHCPSFITFEHNHVNPYKLPYYWIGEMERFCMKAADTCIFPSNYLKNYLDNRRIKTNNPTVIPNPFISPSRPGTLVVNKSILFIGKLSPAKGIFILLDALQILSDEYRSVQVKLVGDNQFYYHARESLMDAFIKQKYSELFASGNIELLGKADTSGVAELLSGGHVVVIPSTIENLPYVAIEAMSYGNLVVASDSGGQIELIENKQTGFLFQSGSAKSLADALRKALSMSERERSDIGRNAQNAVNSFCNETEFVKRKKEWLTSCKKNEKKTVFPFLRQVEADSINQEMATSQTGVLRKLSVAIPYYNLGNLIYETIDSIKKSTLPPFEIIVVDDGSTDSESLQVLKSLADDPAISIIRQHQQGLAVARNAAANIAKGEYLAFLDADDTVEGSYYEKAVNILSAYPNVYFVGAWTRYFGDSVGIWPSFSPEPPFLLFHNMVSSSSLVYKRAAYLQYGLNDPDFIFGMEDYDSILGMIEKGKNGVVIPEPLFNYRVRKRSMARGFRKENLSYTYFMLSRKHSTLFSQYGPEINALLNANGPGYHLDNPTLDYHLGKKWLTQNSLFRKLVQIAKTNKHLRKLGAKIKKRIR